MFDEILLLTENSPTFVTFVGLLSDMDFLVLSEVGFATEGLPTLLTCVGLLSSVTSLVSDEA